MSISALKPVKEEWPFAKGSLVCLKSGGVWMTVRLFEKGQIWADWNNKNDDLCSAEFDPEMLYAVESEGPAVTAISAPQAE